MDEKTHIKWKPKLLQMLMFCALGIVINLGGAVLAGVMRLPLYLDSIGTILAAVLGGYLPGIVVGLATNLLKDISDPTSVYYGTLSVLIAITSAFYSKKGYLKKASGVMTFILLLSAIGGGLGFLLTWCLYGEAYKTGVAQTMYQSGVLSSFQAAMVADYLSDLADKVVSVGVVLLVLKFLPYDDVSHRISLSGWQQAPLSEEDKAVAENSHCRVISLRTKLVIVVVAAAVSIGTVATAISFILYRNNAYVPAEASAGGLQAHEYSYLAKMISLCLGFFILILVVSLWCAEYNVIFPINTMAIAADAFAYNSAEARSDSLARIKKLDIHTGDEIENLYHAFSETTAESMRHVAELQNKTEMIAQMQDGLVMVLADMVESRDKNTGQHVRKTAEYVKIIMEQMLEEGIYKERMTKQFIYDTARSAPLHDVGKINIPDAILNKPGRLTDEEFETMKTHTTAGRDIITRAIKNVPETGYLKEARRIAAHHHERWDGKGYPDGLKGEEIPLSARIMAVADVFDALVSRRSYKEGFPFRKAMDIIREGIGSQFDPKMARAFLHAEAKVREVAETFGELSEDVS